MWAGRRSRISTSVDSAATVFEQHGTENRDSDESIDPFDDVSLMVEDIEEGVLVTEHVGMAQRHEVGVEHVKSYG